MSETLTSDELQIKQTSDPSAFHEPPPEGQIYGTYPPQHSYQSPSYPANYHPPPNSNNFNYQYTQPEGTSPNFHYPTQATGSYDLSYSSYQQNYGQNYNQQSSNHSYPLINPDPTVQVPFTTPPPNYNQWNYNN